MGIVGGAFPPLFLILLVIQYRFMKGSWRVKFNYLTHTKYSENTALLLL